MLEAPRSGRQDLTGRLCFSAPDRVVMLIGLLLAAIGPGVALAQEEVLTNDTVISMVKAGFDENVVILKIQSTVAKFDLRTEALMGLKQAGVSDRIVEAMIRKAAGIAPTPAPTAAPPRPALKDKEVVYHVLGDRYQEIPQSVAQKKSTWYPMYVETEFLASGPKARYRIGDRTPVFLSAYPPDAAPLVKWSPRRDGDRDLEVQSGLLDLRLKLKDKNRVPIVWDRDEKSGLYRIRPEKPLAPGEYGFVVWPTQALQERMAAYEFGVD